MDWTFIFCLFALGAVASFTACRVRDLLARKGITLGSAEERVVRAIKERFEKQIMMDGELGVLEPKEVQRLLHRLKELRAYALLQVRLLEVMIVRRVFLRGVGLQAVDTLLINNCIIELSRKFSEGLKPEVIYSPVMMLNRLTPGWSSVGGGIAMMRAEPLLVDVTERYVERRYKKLGLGFLIPVFTRPFMRAFKWLVLLEWSDCVRVINRLWLLPSEAIEDKKRVVYIIFWILVVLGMVNAGLTIMFPSSCPLP